ncbi:MAG: ATP-binding cassette domain-containing protein [Acidobacteria bacterium]|nr:ATP-binding cassette domain-containing protein [Acidobacteriota bacterium]
MVVSFGDVAFAYAGQPAVLDGFTLAIGSGEIVAIVGRSGAGKTTILKLINGLLLPVRGSVLVHGRDTREWDGIPLRRQTGYVFQDVGLFPHMSVEENVRIVPRLEGWDEKRARARALELLEMVGLPPREFAGRRPHELSGGQRQRVGLARALAVDPRILLMDEPFGALDPITRAEVRAAFTVLQARLGMTVVLVTHDMGEAFSLGARVAVLDRGRMVVCDTPRAVAGSSEPRVRAFLDSLPPAPGNDA